MCSSPYKEGRGREKGGRRGGEREGEGGERMYIMNKQPMDVFIHFTDKVLDAVGYPGKMKSTPHG